jgi:hypothetical protein
MKRSATVLASWSRLFFARSRFLKAKSAAVEIQARWRCAVSSARFIAALNGALVLQNWWLHCLDRRWEATTIASASALQRAWRDFTERKRRMGAATCLQAVVRGHAAMKGLTRARAAAATVQKLVRQVQGASCGARKEFLGLQRACSALQQAVRFQRKVKLAGKAVGILQRVGRGLLGRKRAGKVRQGVLMAQARWRGVVVRVAANKNRRILAVRAKMARAAARAAANPQMRLGNRTKGALDEVINAKMLPQVLKACATLETSTRLSPPCCAAFASGGAAGVLLRLAKTSNRSGPHQELLRSLLSTLNHVANHGCGQFVADMIHVQQPETGLELDTADGGESSEITSSSGGAAKATAEVLVGMAVNFRDKEVLVVKSVDLMLLMAKVDEPFRNALSSPESAKRLASMLIIVERKLGTSSSSSSASASASTSKSTHAQQRGGNENHQTATLAGACARLKVQKTSISSK